MNKKGFAIGDMLPLGMTIVVLGIALSLGLTVLGDFKADQITGTSGCNSTTTGACGNAYNGTVDAEEGLTKFTSYLPTIGLVVVIAVIIGIITRYLFFN